MAAAHARRLLRRRRQRKRRVFQRLRHPPTYLDNDAMFYRFRFSLATITFITDLLSPFITHPSRRSRALSPEQQVLVALRFFGSGSFFRIIGDTFGMSVATVSRCVSRVSLALCRVARRFVNVPMGDAASRTKRAFFDIAATCTLGCSNGWETFDGSCYFLFDIQIDWASAASACGLYHAHLAEITSAHENNYIDQLIRKYHAGHRDVEYWLGGTDGFVEGDWVWIGSQLRMNYTDWYPGEPNSFLGREQDCLLVSIHGHSYHWDDEQCSEEHPYVCEITNVGSAGMIIGRK